MREIKFRAYIQEVHQVSRINPSDVQEIILDSGEPTSIRSNGVEYWLPNEVIALVQFTGLKDKNGVEIYEGDIVAYAGDKLEVIEYIDGAFCFSSGWTLHDLITPPNENKAEVIGNIYENKEILDPTPLKQTRGKK